MQIRIISKIWRRRSKQLQKYKDDVDAFNKRVAEFDEKVVFTDNAPDASEYRKYYEEISPDNAEKIYRQVVKSERSTEKAKELATYYSNMEAASAGANAAGNEGRSGSGV